MADKYRQIQKFVEILGGLVDRSKVINKKIQDTMDENLTQSSVGELKNSEIKNINVTDKLFRKPSLRMVDMGSGMAYLTFSAHSHLSQKFDLGKLELKFDETKMLLANILIIIVVTITITHTFTATMPLNYSVT
jgi:hypothetical protein